MTTVDQSRLSISLRAARLYYVQDLTMEAIASELAVSRSTVSRLIARARSTGLVEIRIHSHLDHAATLEQELADRFQVAAHVVPTTGLLTDIDRLERVAVAAGQLISQFVESNMTIGVAWGSTVGAVSRQLIPKATHGATVVQLNGAANMQTSGIDFASEILQRFGTAYAASVQQFPVPAFFDDPVTKEAMWRERSTRHVLGVIGKLDLAVFGLGSPFGTSPSRVYLGGYMDARDYASLRSERVVGDIATVFYRLDGSWRDITLNARATGPGLDRIKRAPRRVCVVAGVQKLSSVCGALAAGIVTDLVLDEELARRLLRAA